VQGLAGRKNVSLRRRLDRGGVSAFAGSRRYLEADREAGLRSAVVSASADTGEILQRAALADLADQRVDGDTIRRERLQAKPVPDTILATYRLLGAAPESAVAFETTRSGSQPHRRPAFDSWSPSTEPVGRPRSVKPGPTSSPAIFGQLLDPALGPDTSAPVRAGFWPPTWRKASSSTTRSRRSIRTALAS
jgi:hypothetical protein